MAKTKAETIVYPVHNGLYVNLTNRCSCACTFCIRQTADGVGEDGEGGSRMAPPKGGFVVDDSGTMRMMPPTEIQQREGAAISTEERATSGSKSPRKGNNWIYDAKSKGGSFLVAAASKPGTVGGDMIRRIDLSKSISEHDYDSDTPGKQGAFIYVPDELRPAVPSKHVDGEGLYSGILCAMVPGPNQTIIAIGGFRPQSIRRRPSIHAAASHPPPILE